MKSINKFNKKREKTGLWHYYYYIDTSKYAGGKLSSEGFYKNGLREGKWTYYCINGKIITEGKFINGISSGLWIDYNNDGIKNKEKIFII